MRTDSISVSVTQGQRLWCQSKPVCDFLLVSDILSYTVSELSQHVSQIIAFDRGVALFPYSGWTPELRTATVGLKKLETSLLCVMHNMFQQWTV